MPNFAFERPVLTLAALLAPFFIIIGARFFRGAFTLSLSLGAPGGEIFRSPVAAGFWGKLCSAIRIAGVSILLLASSGPIMLTPSVVWIDRGADILFVLDCSPSMAALDIAGKRRFDAACELITDFSRTRPADAIGLVAVGNDAALLIPPTTDRNALFEKLSSLRIGELGDGTALGMGLSVAALHIKDSAAPRRAVVLITDGENNAGAIHPETAATIIAESGASLYIIAVGTSGEVPIDYIDPFTNTRRTGSFDSHYDPSALMSIADSGGGVFIPAPSKEAFSNAFARFSNAEITVSRSGVREKKSPVHTALIIAGTLFVAAGFIVKKIALGAFL